MKTQNTICKNQVISEGMFTSLLKMRIQRCTISDWWKNSYHCPQRRFCLLCDEHQTVKALCKKGTILPSPQGHTNVINSENFVDSFCFIILINQKSCNFLRDCKFTQNTSEYNVIKTPNT